MFLSLGQACTQAHTCVTALQFEMMNGALTYLEEIILITQRLLFQAHSVVPHWCCSRVGANTRVTVVIHTGEKILLLIPTWERVLPPSTPHSKAHLYISLKTLTRQQQHMTTQLYCALDCKRCTIVILVSRNRSTQLARQSCSFWESVEPGVPADISQRVSKVLSGETEVASRNIARE